jgi:hypothetical protein
MRPVLHFDPVLLTATMIWAVSVLRRARTQMQQFRADQHGKKNSLPPRNDPADPDRDIDN